MFAGEIVLPKMDGKEISPGIWLIGEPLPIPNTNLLRCLADIGGALFLVELKLTFDEKNKEVELSLPK